MPTILSVSRDQILLKTREHVLRSAGYDVVSSASLGAAICSLDDSELPDLLLLGHTLKKEEKEELERRLRERSLTTPIVELTNDLYREEVTHKTYFRLAFGDPAQLLNVCRFALGKKSRSSTAS